MSQNISLWGATYSDVPSVLLPKSGGGTARFTDVSDTTSVASDVAQGKYFYLATGEKVAGTNTGGGGLDIPVFTWANNAVTCNKTFNQIQQYFNGYNTCAILIDDQEEDVNYPVVLSGYDDWDNPTYANLFAMADNGPFLSFKYYANGAITIPDLYEFFENPTITQNGDYYPSNGKVFSSVYVDVPSGQPNLQSKTKTYTPTASQQTESVTADSGYDGLDAVNITVNAMPSGTAGTPTATKGTVSNHSVSVTPSVTNTTGYITGSTKTGTAVTVSASELVSGSETKTENGTYDVTNLAQLVVNVASGSSKNAQVVQGTTRTISSTLTAIGAEMTVEKTGTYDVYWSAFRTSTSSYTFGSQLFIDGTAYGSENTTWSNHVQDNHLQNVSLTANQKIRVYGRNSRGTSYYLYAPTLVIIEA